MFGSLSLLAITASGAGLADQQTETKAWGNGPKWGSSATQVKQARTPKSQQLIQNDDLAPTLNRTEALRKEGEDGALWPGVDRALEPKIVMPHITAKKKAGAKHAKVIVRKSPK